MTVSAFGVQHDTVEKGLAGIGAKIDTGFKAVKTGVTTGFKTGVKPMPTKIGSMANKVGAKTQTSLGHIKRVGTENAKPLAIGGAALGVGGAGFGAGYAARRRNY